MTKARDLNDYAMAGLEPEITLEAMGKDEPSGTDTAREPADPEPFHGAWRTLAGWEGSGDWLQDPPPPRTWLLRRPDQASGIRGEGVLPRGKVGMLASAGGVGKTLALLQLAVAVALPDDAHAHNPDRFAWFGGWDGGPIRGGLHVASTGRVLAILGEEDPEEVHRRVYAVAKLYGLVGASGEAAQRWRAALRERLVLVPGAGNAGLALTRAPPPFAQEASGWDPRTHAAREILRRMDDGGEPWALVILDPMSRFAGEDSELDNRAATTLIQVLETLVQAPGNPSVLIAHHTSQAARQAGALDATAARGVTGLSDGIRWQCGMLPFPPLDGAPALVRWGVTKSNYALWPPNLVLSRGDGGVLRVASEKERANYAAAELAAAEEAGERKAERKAAEARGKAAAKGQAPSVNEL